MTDKDREFVENIDEEYYTRVKTSDDFYRRKKLILMNLDRLQNKVEPMANNYEDYKQLKFIVMQRAKQKKSIVKNFGKLEKFKMGRHEEWFNDQEWSSDKQTKGSSNSNDDFDLLYGLENEQTRETKEKIRQSKQNKGRGLLLSFYEFN